MKFFDRINERKNRIVTAGIMAATEAQTLREESASKPRSKTAIRAKKIIDNFIYEKHEDNTELFALNVEGAPTVIEEVYDIAVVPDGYYVTGGGLTRTLNIIIYSDSNSDNTILFRQSTKANFNIHYNTEGHDFEKITVNGLSALYIDYSVDGFVAGSVIWDNGDYIFEVNCDMPKSDIIKLAENVKTQ